MTATQGWLLATLIAFSLGPLGVSLWLASSVLAVVARKRVRLLIGTVVLAGLLASGWVPGLRLYNRLRAQPESRVTASELLLLVYLNLGMAAGMAIVLFGRRRAPRPIPCARELDLGMGSRLLSLHRSRRWSPFVTLPFNQVYALRQRDWEIPIESGGQPLAAELDGFTILHLSDIHFGPYLVPEYFEEARERVRALPHDLLVFTGDFLAREGRADQASEWLKGFVTDRPAFAVLGNHDVIDHPAAEVRAAVEGAGIRLLGGETAVIERGSGSLGFAGLDYQNWWRPFPVAELRGRLPPGAAPILITHTPCPFPAARRAGFALVLCGHTHGGQVRLGGFGAPYIPARHGRRYQMGLYREGKSYLHVHSGLGGPPPLRVACSPEITRLILRRPLQGQGTDPRTAQDRNLSPPY